MKSMERYHDYMHRDNDLYSREIGKVVKIEEVVAPDELYCCRYEKSPISQF